jgi:hypothetical protein
MNEPTSSGLRSTSLQRRTTLGGRRVRASDAQRAKVAGLPCLVCGRSPVDPAHLVPQRFGGCGDPDCVIPLCRAHHWLFDRARLALSPYLDRERLAAELAHALTHVTAAQLRAALEGGWPAPWTAKNDN